jgi:hypothetical protein
MNAAMSGFTILMTSRRSLNDVLAYTILNGNDFATVPKQCSGLWPTLCTILHN